MLANFPCPVNGTFHKFTRPKQPSPHRFVGNFTKGRSFIGNIVTYFTRLPEVFPFRGKICSLPPYRPFAAEAAASGCHCRSGSLCRHDARRTHVPPPLCSSPHYMRKIRPMGCSACIHKLKTRGRIAPQTLRLNSAWKPSTMPLLPPGAP